MYNETSGASTKGLAVNEHPPQHILVMTAKKCGEVAAFRAQAPWDEQREGKTVTQSELAPEQTNEAPALATNASENKTTAQQRARIATLGRQRGRLKLHDWDSPHDLRRRGTTENATSLICDLPSPCVLECLTLKHARNRHQDPRAARWKDGCGAEADMIHIQDSHSPPRRSALMTAAQRAQQQRHALAHMTGQYPRLSPLRAQYHPFREGHGHASTAIRPVQGMRYRAQPVWMHLQGQHCKHASLDQRGGVQTIGAFTTGTTDNAKPQPCTACPHCGHRADYKEAPSLLWSNHKRPCC